MAHLLAWSSFRDAVRASARAGEPAEKIESLCDATRRSMSEGFGVVLSDRGPTLSDPKSKSREAEARLVGEAAETADVSASPEMFWACVG